MKHVFIVNSHTTFLTSMGICEYLNLQYNDVIFLFMRNYKISVIPIHCKTIDITSLFNDSEINFFISGDYQSQVIATVDRFVETNIESQYKLYTPHLQCILFKLLYTNKACKHVAYIQEGAVAQHSVYHTNVSLKKRLRLFKNLRFKGVRTFDGEWYISGCIYKQLFLDSYAINKQHFKHLPSIRHVVKWPSYDINLSISKEAMIFVFDGFVSNGEAESDSYMKNCKRLIQSTSQKENHIKFHPGQSQKEKEIIVSYFNELSIPYNIIPDDIPLELVISSTKNLTFAGFGSSLLYYAKSYGHKVICHDDWMLEMSDMYRQSRSHPLFEESYKSSYL